MKSRATEGLSWQRFQERAQPVLIIRARPSCRQGDFADKPVVTGNFNVTVSLTVTASELQRRFSSHVCEQSWQLGVFRGLQASHCTMTGNFSKSGCLPARRRHGPRAGWRVKNLRLRFPAVLSCVRRTDTRRTGACGKTPRPESPLRRRGETRMSSISRGSTRIWHLNWIGRVPFAYSNNYFLSSLSSMCLPPWRR